MALNLDIFAADFAVMVADLPHYLTYGESDTEIQVIYEPADSRETAELAGMMEGADATAWATVGSDELPGVGDVVSIASTSGGDGTAYRVTAISDSPDGKVRKLLLAAEDE